MQKFDLVINTEHMYANMYSTLSSKQELVLRRIKILFSYYVRLLLRYCFFDSIDNK